MKTLSTFIGFVLGTLLAIGGQSPLAAQVFNTGVDADGVPLPPGASDPHWSIISGPGITAPTTPIVVLNQLTPGWVQDPATRWIWVDGTGAGATEPYTFRLSFDLTGIDINDFSLLGRWGVDNVGSISLNGSNVGIGSGALVLPDVIGANYETLHSFTLDDGFIPGLNHLDFIVRDAQNPGALNVGITAIPEPCSMYLMAMSLLISVAGWQASARRRFARSKDAWQSNSITQWDVCAHIGNPV